MSEIFGATGYLCDFTSVPRVIDAIGSVIGTTPGRWLRNQRQAQIT